MKTADTVVIHIKNGVVYDIWSPSAELKVLVLDSDTLELGDDDEPIVNEFVHEWPDTQFDEDAIKEIVGEKKYNELFDEEEDDGGD